jgi:hypothetical protein
MVDSVVELAEKTAGIPDGKTVDLLGKTFARL